MILGSLFYPFIRRNKAALGSSKKYTKEPDDRKVKMH